MKRRNCSFILAVLLIVGLTISAMAEVKGSYIEQSLSFIGTTAYCSSSITHPKRFFMMQQGYITKWRADSGRF